MALQRDNKLKISALLCVEHKVNEVANLGGVSRTTVYMIKKCRNDGEKVSTDMHTFFVSHKKSAETFTLLSL